jgi:dienelactone hydrolase
VKNPLAASDHVATNIDNSRSSWLIPQAILAVLTVLALCAVGFALQHEGTLSPGGSNDAVPVVSHVGPTSFVNDGPYGVGVSTEHIMSSGTDVPVELWYPTSADNAHGTAAKTALSNYLPKVLSAILPSSITNLTIPLYGFFNVPVAQGQFPIAVFSHGYGGFNVQSTFLMSHLASWGCVVVAPEHTTRDLAAVLNQIITKQTLPTANGQDVRDLTSAIASLSAWNTTSSSPFYNHLDMTRIAAIGHSEGGIAAQQLAATQPNVRAYVGLAGAVDPSAPDGVSTAVPKTASLLMSGTLDKVVPTSSVIRAYDSFHSPKRFIALSNAGHLVFSNACSLASVVNLSELAHQFHVSIPASFLAITSDGCQVKAATTGQAWPVIDQAVVAEVRWAMGFDKSQAGLSGLASEFPSVVVQNTTAPNA